MRRANLVYMVEGSDEDAISAFSNMLDRYQITSKRQKLCRLCLLKHRITPFSKHFVSAGGERICFDCAFEEVKREMGAYSLISQASIRQLASILKKTRYQIALIKTLISQALKNTEFSKKKQTKVKS